MKTLTPGQELDALIKRADEVSNWLSRPYVWSIVDGVRAPQGDCSSCQEKTKRYPEGMACDYSCVGV